MMIRYQKAFVWALIFGLCALGFWYYSQTRMVSVAYTRQPALPPTHTPAPRPAKPVHHLTSNGTTQKSVAKEHPKPSLQPSKTLPLLVSVSKTATNITYRLQRGDQVMHYKFPISHVKFTQQHHVYASFKDALAGQTEMQGEVSQARGGGRPKTIILAVADLGYIEMAINLYVSSLLRLGLSNYLFVCSESTACEILNALNISAYAYVDYKDIGKEASSYFSQQFKIKTHVKTLAILDALNANYNVLITDVDIVFLKDPFRHMPCADCDIQISSDVIEGNSGFYLAKNTQASKTLHADAMSMYEQHPELSNQKTLDRTLATMHDAHKLKYKMLSEDEFQNGYKYYEQGHRMWHSDYPCSSCVIVHNNWIVSNSAKIYRFKEHHHWFVDKNEYYTSPDRGYITYSNPSMFTDTFFTEYEALKSAFWIGHVLNRTVIFPQFHKPRACDNEVCYGHHFATFNTFYSVINLDQHMGHDSYRESSFLENPLVPVDVKDSKLESIIIKTSLVREKQSLITPLSRIFTPASPQSGASLEEIRAWFNRHSNKRVLHFKALYGAVDLDDAATNDPDFAQRLEKAIRKSDYRQYKTSPIEPSVRGWVPAVTASGTHIFLFVVPVFVIPCLCLAMCYRSGVCDMDEAEEYEKRMRSIRRYRGRTANRK